MRCRGIISQLPVSSSQALFIARRSFIVSLSQDVISTVMHDVNWPLGRLPVLSKSVMHGNKRIAPSARRGCCLGISCPLSYPPRMKKPPCIASVGLM